MGENPFISMTSCPSLFPHCVSMWHLGHVWGINWGMSGASSGHVWGMSGACLGQHLGHIVNNGQQWTTICGATRRLCKSLSREMVQWSILSIEVSFSILFGFYPRIEMTNLRSWYRGVLWNCSLTSVNPYFWQGQFGRGWAADDTDPLAAQVRLRSGLVGEVILPVQSQIACVLAKFHRIAKVYSGKPKRHGSYINLMTHLYSFMLLVAYCENCW